MKKKLKLRRRGTSSNFDTRDCNIDIIRVIACVAVVGLHTFPKDLSIVTASLYYLSGFAVPFFFMSSGYFLLNRGELNYKYAGRKCVGIIKIVFFWNCILYAVKFGKTLVFDKIFEIICCIFVIVTLYVSMNYITDITLEEQIVLYVFIVAVLIVIVCVGRMHARMIYQIKIEDNEIICHCGCKAKGRKFEKEKLESMIETSNKKYLRPIIIKDNKIHKGIYPTDFAGVKVKKKKQREF